MKNYSTLIICIVATMVCVASFVGGIAGRIISICAAVLATALLITSIIVLKKKK